MQRSASEIGGTARARAALAAVVAVTAGALALGCSADLGGTDDATGSEPPPGTTMAAEPGRFSALPEPCGSVEAETLRELLPDADDEAFEGEPAPTFDTGRRVGCAWNSPSATATHQLIIDFERVISYDPEISDEGQAELDFEALATEDGVPLDGTGAPVTEDSGESGEGDGGDDEGSGTESPQGGLAELPITPEGELSPRPLDDIGHVAYLDDELTSDDAQAQREVVVAFRSANVIVTVTYTVSTTVTGETPDSALLQEQTQRVAQQLAGGFDE